MPPKKKTAVKRKAASESPSDNEASASKKAKVSKDSSEPTIAANGQPTNKVLPVNINFPPQIAGTVRLSTWNICSLASASKKGFKSYVEAEDPDILVLTETKVNEVPVDPFLTSRFPHCTWAISSKKSYSGTAVLSKHKPLSVDTKLPGHPDPSSVKGRIVTVEFPGCYIVATYATNAGQGLKTLKEKNTWNEHFTTHIRDLDTKKPVIWMGDLNVAPTAIDFDPVYLTFSHSDLANPKSNWNKTPGYTKDETEAFQNILDPPESAAGAGKFVDVWRQNHPEDKHYTYFSYRFDCRTKGLGWRLDMFVVSERLVEKVKMCEIRSEIYGASDHVPVVMEIESSIVTGS
ncbi:Endonuclease/exonuclease/phosphatase [Suillus clintonianus]|uniref:Endonuclease/exonuclease/phosphatase n=1 Tax=Suillus clintonianus TaxID=1904413 RepID=UPI001B87886E|nr:Endonuclease/exonuclease/phosphatase [Suillus clintonianus]KAG2157224.1 Endonuclease/exonuclease/phosphatase [Suillus clintonianus]